MSKTMEKEVGKKTVAFYQHVLRTMQEKNMPFLVGGAFAMGAYTGIHRFTKDLDLFVTPKDGFRVLPIFKSMGFRTEVTDDIWITKVFAKNGDFVDFIFRSGNGLSEVDDEWFRRAQPGKVFGVDCWLCPPEEIIFQKAFIMERERFDGADIAHYILAYGRQLDWDFLIQRFDEHWPVLLSHLLLFQYSYPGKADTIPESVMGDLLDRSRNLAHAGRTKECRGTLLSRANYLIDTLHWGFKDSRFQARHTVTAKQVKSWRKSAAREQKTILKERGIWLDKPTAAGALKKVLP